MLLVSLLTLTRYNAELAPPEVRGALVALQQLAITFGIMVSYCECSPSCLDISFFRASLAVKQLLRLLRY